MSIKIKGKIKIVKIRYIKNDWGIAVVAPIEFKGAKPDLDEFGTFIIKGTMIDPKEGEEYQIVAEEIEDPKWGLQYDIVSFTTNAHVDENSENSKRKYLEHIFTEGQVNALYEALADPFTALKIGNAELLTKVRGCGLRNAARWINKFNANYYLSRLYVELEEFGLTPNMMKRLLDYYKSPELVVKRVKENPYLLTEVGGVGFKTADNIAMTMGMPQWDERRIGAYILYSLDKHGREGNSFVLANELMDELVEQFGEDIPDLAIASTIHGDIKDRLWWSEDKSEIGLKRYYKLEENIRNEIKRISEAPVTLYCEDIDARLDAIENRQGWQFTDQQRLGIKTANESNLAIINGFSGTGKTTIAKAITEIFGDIDSAACCLSGKAAARLGEVIGTPGSTIHRLLGFNPEIRGFTHDKENPLSQQLIIIDEISMIGGSLFYSLLQAVASGTKVVMLGDTGQLEAIGECNVANDLINSNTVPVVTLNKIHRQAAKSAIITESLKVRNGTQIISKDYAGIEILGENQDLVLDCYSDKANTAYKTLEYFKSELAEYDGDVLKVQMIVPMRSRGEVSVWNLNKLAQDYCNPDEGQDSVKVKYANRGLGELRVGDKVIATQNNYKDCYMAESADGEIQSVPIFNGYIGIIDEIDPESYMVIDFLNLGRVIVPSTMFSTIELAYAITVHKFQGAQIESVIVALDYSAYSLLSKELVYTAITRAQKKCTLVAQNSALRFAVDTTRTSTKKTHLERLLKGEYESKELIF
jgi:exodeoxyribonuclease V alpha subunit